METLREYCFNFDLTNPTISPTEMYNIAINEDFKKFNQLLKNEIKFRKETFKNFVVSLYGTQGDGKSAGGYTLCTKIAEEFGKEFTPKNVFYTFSELDKVIQNRKESNHTYFLDEQKQSNYGIMANKLLDDMADYEDQLRIDQTNLIYAAPELRQHTHFFVFKTLPDPIGITRNKEGYPISVKLMVYLQRHYDDYLLPRGIVNLKFPEKKIWNEYNERKKEHIRKLKSKQEDRIPDIETDALKVIKKYGKDLIKTKKDGKLGIKNARYLELKVLKTIGTSKYTMKGIVFVVEELQEQLKKEYDLK